MSSVISVKYFNGGEYWTVVYRNSPPYVLEFDEDLNEIWPGDQTIGIGSTFSMILKFILKPLSNGNS